MKLNFYSKKNLLDEMQQQTANKLLARCFWVTWVGLIAIATVQSEMGVPLSVLAPELLLALGVGAYAIWGFVRQGIWDSHFRANGASVAAGALCAGAIAFLFSLAARRTLPAAVMTGGSTVVLTAAVCGAILLFCRLRRGQLDNEPEETEAEEDFVPLPETEKEEKNTEEKTDE